MFNASGFTSSPLTPDDGSLIERICAAYRHSYSTFGRSDHVGDSQWSIINGWKSAAHDALTSRNGAAELLRFPCSNNLFFGFDSLFSAHTEALRTNPIRQEGEALLIAKAIERLAESLGLIRTPNPEAPGILPPQEDNIESLLFRIATSTTLNLSFPNPFPDEFGILTSRGIVSLRPVFAIYQAYRLKQMSAICGDNRILEIGAGVGRTAFYANCMGLTEYTIIDLPLANAAQAYFLGRTVGPDNIVLAGEKHTAPIKILPPSRLDELQVGVTLNADSLTEMDRTFAERYVQFARLQSEVFVSINHEVNTFTANEVIRSIMPEAILVRYQHPMRPGYIEEIAFKRSAASN